MNRQVEFQTDLFPELPGEKEDEDNVNGIIGKGLCEWIHTELPKHGQGTEGDVMAEDFGWLSFLEHEFPIWIACTNQGDDSNGIASYTVIVVAEFPRGGLFRKGPDPKPALEQATSALQKLIESEPRITAVKWFE